VIDLDELDARGYTTVELLDRDGVAECRALVDALGVDPDDPYWVSSVHGSRTVSSETSQALIERLVGPIGRHLADHVPFMAAVISKGRGGGTVGLLPDWTYLDERQHRARVFWCSLTATDESNGAMVVVPGSHRTMRGLRGSGPFPSPVAHVEDELWRSQVVTVPLRAGEAVVWDAAVLHGSWPNPSPSARAAAVIGMVPSSAQLVHFHLDDDAGLAGVEVDGSYFVEQAYASRPTGFREIEPWDDVVRTYEDVDEVLAASQA
jgi:hypothetical protein